MRESIPDECLLSLPAEITPDLARSCADKMNLLLQVQLLARSLSDKESAFRLLLDLARELTPYEKAVLAWRDDPEEVFQIRASRGFDDPAAMGALRSGLLTDGAIELANPVLVPPRSGACPGLTPILDKVGASSFLSMPLYIGDRVMGRLQLFRKRLPSFRVEEAHLIRVFTFTFESVIEALIQSEKPREIAYMDRRTGLFNRRYFEQQLERELDRARRNNESVSVLLLEVQGFEALRDSQGQIKGEAALQEIASGLQRVCRKSDTVARYQDDQFGIILPRTGKDSLAIAAHRVFGALDRPFVNEGTEAGVLLHMSGVAYPDDAFSPETILETSLECLGRIRGSGQRYYQFPSPASPGEEEDILDAGRVGLFREPLLAPPQLLRIFAKLCLDSVPAGRVSIMVLEESELVVQVAFGFENQEEVIRTTRVPLNAKTVSAWVAQRREPLLVPGSRDAGDLPLNRRAAYRNQSFFSYPLLYQGDLIGVIHFSNRADGGVFTAEDLRRFEPLAGVIARYLALGNRFGRLQEDFLQDGLFALIDLMETQIPGMERHSQEVARLAAATATQMGFSDEEVDRLRVSSRLHDLGKVSYRARVLSEPRALSPRERALAQRHPLLAWKFLEDFPMRRVDREAILYHHEREDGSGYLRKSGGEIPQAAKILGAADVFQALISPRPYRPAVPVTEALEYMELQKGILFDSQVIDALKSAILERVAQPESTDPSSMYNC